MENVILLLVERARVVVSTKSETTRLVYFHYGAEVFGFLYTYTYTHSYNNIRANRAYAALDRLLSLNFTVCTEVDFNVTVVYCVKNGASARKTPAPTSFCLYALSTR